MRKKRVYENSDDVFIDLSDRKDVKIIPAKKKKSHVYDTEMKEFEERLNSRYDSISSFTNLCIQKRLENNMPVPNDVFDMYMKELLESNELLKDMIDLYLVSHKEQEN